MNMIQGANPIPMSSHTQIAGTMVTEENLKAALLSTKKNGFKCLLGDKRRHLSALHSSKTNITNCLQQIDKTNSTTDNQTIYATRFESLPLCLASATEIKRMDSNACAVHMVQSFTLLRELNGSSGVPNRRLEISIKSFMILMDEAIDQAAQNLEDANCQGHSILKGLPLSDSDRRRPQLQDGGTEPQDAALQTCPYCKCEDSVDCHPENVHVLADNKVLENEHNEKVKNVSVDRY